MTLDDLIMPKSIKCFNGAFESNVRKIQDNQDKALRMIQECEPEAHITYYPVEEQWKVHVWGKPLSDMFYDKGLAIWDALKRLGAVDANK